MDAGSSKPEARDYQVGGDHYRKGTLQPWDVVEAFGLDFWEGNALKYLLRSKPGTKRAEDLRKAIHYLQRCVERAERAHPNHHPGPE
jgi:hypothetical protein